MKIVIANFKLQIFNQFEICNFHFAIFNFRPAQIIEAPYFTRRCDSVGVGFSALCCTVPGSGTPRILLTGGLAA